MKDNNENLERTLDKLIASTRSPKGKYLAENSWQLLETDYLSDG